MSESVTLELIEHAQPYPPDGQRVEHADDAQRPLQRLKERGAERVR